MQALESFTPSFLVWEDQSIPLNTLHHLEELGPDSQKAHKTALEFYARSVHYAHKLTTIRHAPGTKIARKKRKEKTLLVVIIQPA